MMPGPHVSPDTVEAFVRLLTTNERRIFGYILTLAPNVADAEDIWQETSVVLWQKFADYQPGTDFTAWAFRTAYNTVRTFRAKQRRCRVRFDDQLLAEVSDQIAVMQKELDFAQVILRQCAEELRPADRDLLRRRYETKMTIKSLAAAVGRPVEGLYKAMRRIHDALYDCVQRRLSSEGIHVPKL
jgi:RNA polymerase sigma-70 factor, ECF subfamily